jgi:hypothetical protein
LEGRWRLIARRVVLVLAVAPVEALVGRPR